MTGGLSPNKINLNIYNWIIASMYYNNKYYNTHANSYPKSKLYLPTRLPE